MRHILRGFTCFLDGVDYGYEIDELTPPVPKEVTIEHRAGGMDLGVTLPMAALEPMEATLKFASINPGIMGAMALAPGLSKRFTIRGAAADEADGRIHAHEIIIQGRISEVTPDTWQRAEKSGLEVMVRTITYYKWRIDEVILHEIQADPAKRVINGVDQLSRINEALGR